MSFYFNYYSFAVPCVAYFLDINPYHIFDIQILSPILYFIVGKGLVSLFSMDIHLNLIVNAIKSDC